jgi:formylglycine-generating enzyme required for sulfatase activity
MHNLTRLLILIIIQISLQGEAVERVAIPAIESVAIPACDDEGFNLQQTGLRTIHVKPFEIQKQETTCRAWMAYLETTTTVPERKALFAELCMDELQPVSFVTWEEAQAFCRAHGGKLPSESQWMAAAGVNAAASECYEALPNNRFFHYAVAQAPETVSPQKLACITQEDEEEVQLDAYLGIKHDVDEAILSLNGLQGMMGNLMEWVDAEVVINHQTFKVLKGGSFTHAGSLKLYDNRLRFPAPSSLAQDNAGFRCIWERKTP